MQGNCNRSELYNRKQFALMPLVYRALPGYLGCLVNPHDIQDYASNVGNLTLIKVFYSYGDYFSAKSTASGVNGFWTVGAAITDMAYACEVVTPAKSSEANTVSILQT